MNFGRVVLRPELFPFSTPRPLQLLFYFISPIKIPFACFIKHKTHNLRCGFPFAEEEGLFYDPRGLSLASIKTIRVSLICDLLETSTGNCSM